MPLNKYLVIVGLIMLLLTGRQAYAQTYVFAELKGTPMNTAGWNLQGGARLGNINLTGNQEMIVCPTNAASGAAFYNQPINLSLCNKWKAEFDFRIHDGTGADGLAFCFLDVPPVGFVTGGGLGIPATANGLKICFDTWNNCIPFTPGTVHFEMPKIEIRYGNGYNECAAQPTFINTNGQLNFMVSAEYHRAKIEYNNGKIDVYVDSTLYLSANQTFDFAGYLGFTASTGGYNDNHSIKNVIIYTDMPPSVAGQDIAVCPNQAATIGDASTPGYVYAWTGPAGLSATNVANPTVNITNNGTTPINAVYTVKTSFASNPGCGSVDSITVRVNPRPKVNFSTPAICLNDAVAVFNDSTIINDPSSLPLTYRWKFGDPNASAGNPNTSLLQNPTHRYSEARPYGVLLTATSSHGCSDSLEKLFTINGSFPKAEFTFASPTTQCSNQPFAIQNTSTVNFGSITRSEIWWDYTNQPAGILNDKFPALPATYQHTYVPLRGKLSKTITVKVKVYSGLSCFSETSKTVTLNPLPTPLLFTPGAVCQNDPVFKIVANPDTAGQAGKGYFLGTGIDSFGGFNPLVSGAGLHKVTYFYTTQKSCTDTTSLLQRVWPLPEILLPPQFLILDKTTATLTAEATGLQLQYLWTPATYLNNPRLLQPLCTPAADTRYTLTATGTGGCTTSKTTQVTVLKLPQVPNAFSPNADGINDTWAIQYLQLYPSCKVTIFNRYGQLLYSSVGYNSPWNGTCNGAELPVGTYYYIIEPGLGLQAIKGYVAILR